MRISDFEIANRKILFSFTESDAVRLKKVKPYIETELNELVDDFYNTQTSIPDIALLIGDSDTLHRLRGAQKAYILDLFSGYYDIEYVNNRLRIGLVHKRIGVDPRLYLSAIQTLKELISVHIRKNVPEDLDHQLILLSFEKLLMFDISLVFDTYIRSLVSEIEISKEKSEQYARDLEEKVRDRTQQLEILSRTDALTGLLNRQHFDEMLTQYLRAAQRRNESVTVAYIDVNDFKIINDTEGHQRGDEILIAVASAIKNGSRVEDLCFRYGGDEFCIVMPNCTSNDAKEGWKNRVIQLLQESEAPPPELSIGYAQTGPDEYVSGEDLIKQADEEMYRVKQKMKKSKI